MTFKLLETYQSIKKKAKKHKKDSKYASI